MKLWKRAAAAIKDRKSLIAVGFSRRSNSTFRNPDLEAAIIKATSHDDSSVDYSNAHRVYKWIRASPLNLKTLIHALSSRVNHTRSWIVALKSLMLLHGILCCKLPSVIGEIRHLPFDLSSFCDGHSSLSKTWGFNIFVRTYFAFLGHYSSFLSDQIHRHRINNRRSYEKGDSITVDIERIQKLQSLLDMILQIRPTADNMKQTIIFEAMDCIVLESINIYGRICNGIIKILPNVGETEAKTVLKIVQKAKSQNEDLVIYFEFCKCFGISNAQATPQFIRIPKDEVEAIEKMINGVEEKRKSKKEEEEAEEKNAIMVLERSTKLQTIITDKWEVFEDDDSLHRKENEFQNLLPLIVMNQPVYVNYTMPDLITF